MINFFFFLRSGYSIYVVHVKLRFALCFAISCISHYLSVEVDISKYSVLWNSAYLAMSIVIPVLGADMISVHVLSYIPGCQRDPHLPSLPLPVGSSLSPAWALVYSVCFSCILSVFLTTFFVDLSVQLCQYLARCQYHTQKYLDTFCGPAQLILCQCTVISVLQCVIHRTVACIGTRGR